MPVQRFSSLLLSKASCPLQSWMTMETRVRIRFDFGAISLEAETLETPTAKAIRRAADCRRGADLGRGGVFRNSGHGDARERCARGGYAGRDCLLAGWP